MTLLDIAADIEELLRKFNPLQPRDDDGKWSDGMPVDLVSAAISVLGGTVTAKASRGSEGSATLEANGRSVNLTVKDLRELRKQVINAQYGDDKYVGDDGVYRVVRRGPHDPDGQAFVLQSEILVSLRPVDGAYVTETGKRVPSVDAAPEDEEVYSAEFDMVIAESLDGDFGDEPMIRVSLKDLDDRNRKGLYDALDRATAARRVDTGNGPTDVFSPRPGAVGLRMKDDQGNPTEVILNARDFKRINSAISDVMYGEGEGLDADELTVDRDTRGVVDTSGGPVEVRFKGRYTGSDWVGTLTILPSGLAPWGVAVEGPHIADFNAAFDRNGEQAGFIRGSVTVRPEVRAIVRDLLRKFNPLQPRDEHGRWSKRSGVLGSVLDQLGSLRDKLSDDDRSVLDAAMAKLHKLESSDVDDDDLIEDDPDEDDDDDSEEEDDDENDLVVDTGSGEVQFTVYDDGDIDLDWDEGGFRVTAASAHELQAGMAKLKGLPVQPGPPDLPPREQWPDWVTDQETFKQWYNQFHTDWAGSPAGQKYNGLAGEFTTSDGDVKVARYGSGVYEVGDPEDIAAGEGNFFQLDDDDEAEAFLAMLRQALGRAGVDSE